MEDKSKKNDVSIDELLKYLFSYKKNIFFILLLVMVFSLFMSLSIPNKYKSHTLLAPAQSLSYEDNALSNVGVPFGGIFGSQQIDNKTLEAIEFLKSFDFFKIFSDEVNPAPELIASKSYNSKTKDLIYDETIYLPESNEWLDRTPSELEAFLYFKSIYSVSINQETGFITISISHISPYIAKSWVENIVILINEKVRREDQESAIKSINYLKEQLSITDLSEIRYGLSQLIQQETKKLTLTNISKDYVFKTIQSPYIPEFKSSPNRPLILIFGTILGAFLTLLFFISRFLLHNK